MESPNSFTGGVNVSAGTLRVTYDAALGDPANSIAIDGATLNVGGSFNTNRGVAVNQATIKVDNAATFTISSQVTGAGGLTKTGGGTLLLAHANSFAPQLAINAGDVSVSADNALGNAANSLSFNGGGLTVTAGFTTSRFVFLDTSGGTFSVGGPSSTLTASGQFVGKGMLTKTGPGTLVLANVDNSYDGGTDIVDGTLRIGADAMLGPESRTLTFDSGGSPVLNTTADIIMMSRPINLNNASATFDVNAGTTLTLSGVIGGPGGFVKIGGGKLVFTDANSYSGATLINSGTLQSFVRNATAPGSALNVAGGATLDLGGFDQSIGSLSGAGNVTTTGASGFDTLTIGNDGTCPAAFSGVMSDAPGGRMLAVTKVGTGTLKLSGANTYSGGTTLNHGGLNINSTNAIGSGPFSVSDGTTIDNTSSGAITLAANNRQTWGGSFTFAGTQSLNFGTGAVTLNANPTVTVSASTLTVGVIGDGTGNSLIKSGAGTLIVFGGALYTGTTAVNAGTLTINGAAFSSRASTVAAAATMNFVNGANAGNGTFANTARRTARSPAV